MQKSRILNLDKKWDTLQYYKGTTGPRLISGQGVRTVDICRCPQVYERAGLSGHKEAKGVEPSWGSRSGRK